MIYSEPKEIGKILIKNRFVRSATYRRMAKEDGDISNELLEMYKTLAKGGVGLIITGYAYVQKSGISFPGQLGADRDSLIPSLKRIAKTIHDNGDGYTGKKHQCSFPQHGVKQVRTNKTDTH